MAFWKKSQDPTPLPEDERRKQQEANLRAFLSAISFDTDGWQFDHESIEKRIKVWITPEDDDVSLNFFPIPPDLPVGMPDVAALRPFLESLMDDDIQLVEVGIATVGGMKAVRSIIKIPMQPHGMAYVGSFTLPFRDVSYVVKVQCREQGITGIREAVLLADKLSQGASFHRNKDGSQKKPRDWDTAQWHPDSEEYDAEFSTHPISRLRRVLKHLEATLKIASSLQDFAPFQLPDNPAA